MSPVILRRVLSPIVLALLGSLLVLAPPHAHAAVPRGPGFAIPHADGSPGSWIGSYAVHGVQTYCADPLRRGSTTAALDAPRRVARSWRDVTGRRVPTRDLQRVAWIASRAGVTDSRVRAAAVDTAIYALLGRGHYAWGGSRSEARMRATGRYDAVRRVASSLLRGSARQAGATRLRLTATPVTYGGTTTVTATVTTEYGVPLAGLSVRADHPLDDLGPVSGVTDAHGQVRWTFRPTRAGSASLTATVERVATRFPEVLVPADHRFQRLVVAGAVHDVSRSVPVAVAPAPVDLTTVTSAPVIDPGDVLRDTVTVTAPDDFHAVVTARLYGPFATRPTSTSCTADVVLGTVTRDWTGAGTFATDPVGPLTQPGYYTWVEDVPATGITRPARTTCGEETETSLVRRYRPELVTVTSRPRATVGVLLTDEVRVRNLLPGTTARATAYLAGPFATRGEIRCRVSASHHVAFAIDGLGIYTTPALQVTRPGWYSWFEVLPATSTSQAVRTPCRVPSETSLITRPQVPVVDIDTGPDRTVRATARAGTSYLQVAAPEIGLRTGALATKPVGGVLHPPAAEAAWYAATARFPDLVGTMVLAGHVGTRDGRPGPFGRLVHLSGGDPVTITSGGLTRRLEVTSIRRYPRREPLPQALFDQTGAFRVALVTCAHKVTRPDGSWHYTDNLVVIAR